MMLLSTMHDTTRNNALTTSHTPSTLPLLSVIVPIYNTATYLPKCLNSIIGQTYPYLEILLAVRLSSDGSNEICDEYRRKDPRIQIIYQQGKGLSDARNSALNVATGEYIAFVDSDDYLAPNTYEKMIHAAITENADMVVDDFYMILETGLSRKKSDLNKNTPLSEIKDMFLEDRLPNYVWNKIYRKTLFDGTRFIKTQGFEDLEILPRLIRKVSKIAVIQNAGYYYNCMNMQALSAVFNHNRKLNVSTKYSLFIAWKEHEKVAREIGSITAEYAENRAIKSAISALAGDIVHTRLTEEERNIALNYLDFRKNVRIGKKYRLLYWSIRHCSFICKLYDYGSFVWRKHKGKINKLQD